MLASPSVNKRSMNSLTIGLLSVVMPSACANRGGVSTPTSLGVVSENREGRSRACRRRAGRGRGPAARRRALAPSHTLPRDTSELIANTAGPRTVRSARAAVASSRPRILAPLAERARGRVAYVRNPVDGAPGGRRDPKCRAARAEGRRPLRGAPHSGPGRARCGSAHAAREQLSEQGRFSAMSWVPGEGLHC